MHNGGRVNLHIVLTIFLGLGMVLFGVLAVIAYNHDAVTTANLNDTVSRAKAAAAADQKKLDDAANIKANELPYRTYTALPVDGGFSLNIPKSWSLYAGHNSTDSVVQLDLIADLDVVNNYLNNKVINTHAFHLQLLNKTQTNVIRSYDDKIKKKDVSSKTVQVSGINATWLEGAIDDQRHNGVVVILPIRDKTMVISTDSHDYLSEFNNILSQAKIIP
ncbi:MAG TPA: hypothetical protein VLF21_00880 [Candidatus Saccharimonadales bacterium]|nr:hypothetical protein [Candidatus Saccharimonadales bacterium]